MSAITDLYGILDLFGNSETYYRPEFRFRSGGTSENYPNKNANIEYCTDEHGSIRKRKKTAKSQQGGIIAMNKTMLLDAIGNVLMDLMESFEIEDEDVIESLVSNGLSTREINTLGLFDKAEVKDVKKTLQNQTDVI